MVDDAGWFVWSFCRPGVWHVWLPKVIWFNWSPFIVSIIQFIRPFIEPSVRMYYILEAGWHVLEELMKKNGERNAEGTSRGCPPRHALSRHYLPGWPHGCLLSPLSTMFICYNIFILAIISFFFANLQCIIVAIHITPVSGFSCLHACHAHCHRELKKHALF